MRIASRMLAPLVACGIGVGAAVIGGACVVPTSSGNQPALQSGIYVLTQINGQSPPGTFTDSLRSLRIFADTFNLDATTLSFDEHTSAAITPRGGVQQPVALIIINRQSYFTPSTGTVSFLLTIFGTSTPATILSSTSFQLQLPDHSAWRYDIR